jgi:hypothetical protein
MTKNVKKFLQLMASTSILLGISSQAAFAATTSEGLQLYARTSTIWSPRIIPVCWENPSDNLVNQMNWTRNAVERTWEAVSAVNFTGWNTCNSNSSGIRIRIEDAGPHVIALGNQLNARPNGMVLNFAFNNWTGSVDSSGNPVESCADGGNAPSGFATSGFATHSEFCIRTIAVHEFGHALGFAHEQNRPDTPTWCDERQGSDGDTVIGAWDLNSVMNYCNPNWSGNGLLSATDIAGVQTMYGTPFALQVGTGLHETDGTFDFNVADWDRDGKPDLVAIKKSNTGSRSTEVHILSGSSNFSRFILQTGTGLHETGENFDFQLGDWNRDGITDLIAIKKNQTGTRSTEVHILSGHASFSNFILQTGTALHETDSNFVFDSSDWDQDGYADLFAIKKSATGTGRTEVHVVSAATYR